MSVKSISISSSKNYSIKSYSRQQSVLINRNTLNFGSYDSFESHDVVNSCLNSIPPENRTHLTIEKTMFRHNLSGSQLEKPFTLKVNNNVFQGEQNEGIFNFRVNTVYGEHAKSYEGNLNGKNFLIKSSNPWGTSELMGTFDDKPVNLVIKVKPDRNKIAGNIGDNLIDLEIITFMHRHKIEGTINDKKIDLNLNRNNLYGKYEDSNNLLPLLYAMYMDRLLKDVKF